MPHTVSEIDTISLPYLGTANGLAPATTIGMLNSAMPQVYSMGMWKGLTVEIQVDCSTRHIVLPKEYESILLLLLNDERIPINATSFEYQTGGPGLVNPGSGTMYGIIDEGIVPLMRAVPTGGIEQLIFTVPSVSAGFSSGDTATITYTDSENEDGYAQVVLPLHNITGTIASASSANSGESTLLVLTATVAGFVAGMGIDIASTSGDTEYEGTTWRVESVTTALGVTNLQINKEWSDTLTGTISSPATLIPENTIASVESISYASLPGRTLIKDSDGRIYGILTDTDGVAAYRRYKVPQVPESTTETWIGQLLVKRRWIPVASSTDFVWLDSIAAISNAMLAVNYRNNGDAQRADYHWSEVKRCLEMELAQTRGGVKYRLQVQPWLGGPVRGLYG